MIWASISRLMRIVGGTVRFTDRFADTLPRRQSRASEARNAGSSPSNPGGNRNRSSSDRPLTLFSSQAQEIPSASPSVRANPVMLKTPKAASRLLQRPVIAAARRADNVGCRSGLQRRSARHRLRRRRTGNGVGRGIYGADRDRRREEGTLLALRSERAAVQRDIAVVVGQILGKHVPARAVGDEIQIGTPLRLCYRAQRGAARIVDRPWRQSLNL